MSYGEVKLEELCAQITDGKHGDCEAQADSGFYFLSCKDVVEGKLNYDGARQITEAEFLDTHRRTKLEPFDILITNSGTIGRMAVAPPVPLTRKTTFQKSVAILKPLPARIEPRFLYYLLQGESERLIGFAGGTAQKNLLLRDLRAFTVRVPTREIQTQITSVLSAYDDLIENNTRRIKILEEMAQMIYREWFVNFRFPGHENVQLVESELGPIPEGWKAGTVAQMVILHRQGINPLDFPTEVFVHFSIPSFDNNQTPVIEAGREIKSNKYRVVPESVLLSKLNPRIPRLWLPPVGTGLREITSTEFLVLTSRVAGHRAYLFQFLSSPAFTNSLTGRSLGTSTSHQRVKPDDLLSLPSLLPSRLVVDDFCGIVNPIMEEVLILRKKTSVLRTTRDFLLPKLISGEIPVEAAEETIAHAQSQSA